MSLWSLVLRLWRLYIHRQRKEWDAKEKEMVACRLVELIGRAGAANILGMTVREIFPTRLHPRPMALK